MRVRQIAGPNQTKVCSICGRDLPLEAYSKGEELREQLYVYPKNGHQYLPLFRCRLKCPASGQWFDALIYQDYDSKHLYVREKKDFFDKFVKLIDWKDGDKSGQC